jgi:hypothetical protein
MFETGLGFLIASVVPVFKLLILNDFIGFQIFCFVPLRSNLCRSIVLRRSNFKNAVLQQKIPAAAAGISIFRALEM